MTAQPTSSPRSFRLSADTLARLDAAVALSNENRNSMVERLLNEALRRESHPLIMFRTGAGGLREPQVIGTRILVRQFVTHIRDEDGDMELVAESLNIPLTLVRAAASYFAEFRDEIDADIRANEQFEGIEYAKWQREQAAFK